MEKMGFITGDVFQIPLPNNLGFSYAIGVNLLKIREFSNYPSLIKVCNIRNSETVESLVIDSNVELVLCPLLIAGIQKVLKNKLWSVVGHITLDDCDVKIPDYKKNEQGDWYFVNDADISTKKKTTYENVKHLETLGAIGAELVGTKIAMALLKSEGKDISDYFDLESYFEKYFYEETLEIPTYCKQKNEIKGRAITPR